VETRIKINKKAYAQEEEIILPPQEENNEKNNFLSIIQRKGDVCKWYFAFLSIILEFPQS